MDLSAYITDVPDFPKPGILFKDIMPLLADGQAFAQAVARMAEPLRAHSVDLIAAVEARGFILGGAIARLLGVGFVPLRKPGKLPGATLSVEYALEYGTDILQLRAGTVARGARVALIDDVLATGGTLAAASRLLTQATARVVHVGVLIELAFLNGRERLPRDVGFDAVLRY
jgi:adenine phosphoribosyltransferase